MSSEANGRIFTCLSPRGASFFATASVISSPALASVLLPSTTSSRTVRPTQLGGVGRQLLDHAPVRRLDEAVVVDDGVRRQRADQADVRAFRRLDRADAAVVAVVHVAHVEAGAVARETAGTEGGELALVRQLRQRVRLVHELRELRAAEELLHRGDDRADVDQRARRRLVRVGDRHALADDALHAQEADAELVLDQLADGTHAAVAEVVDVVRRRRCRC